MAIRQNTAHAPDATDTKAADLASMVADNIKKQVSVCHDQLHLLSKREAEKQLEYASEILKDPGKLGDAVSSYSDSMVQSTIEKSQKLYGSAIEELDKAMQAEVISSASYGEWVQWLHDENRSAYEKTTSIRGELMRYIKTREPLAAERSDLRKRTGAISAIKDAELQGMIETLNDNDLYFEKMDISQRWNLVRSIRACLSASKGGDAHEKKYKDLRAELVKEGTGSQPAFHRDRVGEFLEKIFAGDPTPKEIDKRMDTLRGYIKDWRKVNVKFWTMRKKAAFKGINMAWPRTSAFLGMGWAERQAHVAEMEKLHDRAQDLRSRARGRINGAAKALDASGPDRWFNEYVFNGRYDIDTIESIIDGPLVDRLEDKQRILADYDKLAGEAAAKGLKIPSPGRAAFIGKHFREQLADTQDMEEAIWEAQDNTRRAKEQPKTSADEPKDESERKKMEAEKTVKDMREIVALTPAENARKLDEEVLAAGPEVTKRFFRQQYNLKWAWENGYIKNQSSLDNLETASMKETETVLERGHSKNEGENIHLSVPIDHQKKNALREYNGIWTWTVEHLDSADPAARHAKIEELKSENEARDYWKDINTIPLSLRQQVEKVTTVNWRLKGKAFQLEKLGYRYTPFGDPAAMEGQNLDLTPSSSAGKASEQSTKNAAETPIAQAA